MMQKDTWGIVKYRYSTSAARIIPVLHLLPTASAPQPPAAILTSIKDDQEFRHTLWGILEEVLGQLGGANTRVSI